MLQENAGKQSVQTAEEFRNVWYFYHNTTATIQKQSEEKQNVKPNLISRAKNSDSLLCRQSAKEKSRGKFQGD